MRAIAIENLKGGVGKTVTTISLAHVLVESYRKRVLVVDCDGQCNLTRFYLGEVPDTVTLAEVLTGEHEPYWLDNVQETGIPGLRLIPATSGLYGLDVSAIQRGSTSLGALRLFSPRSAACVDYRRWVAELLGKEGGITHGKV